MRKIRLGLNIDHVATLRNARGGMHPDPIEAAKLALQAGADGIVAHLREDRRHIRDDDVERLKKEISAPLNLEMAATEEMRRIALSVRPHAICLVPEKRQELTTEGGLDAVGQEAMLKGYVKPFLEVGIYVSLFIDPELSQVEASKRIGVPAIEFHTGNYAAKQSAYELDRLKQAAREASGVGIHCHAGHGLNYENVAAVAAIEEIEELNIGHYLIGQAVYTGLVDTIHTMRKLMDEARK